MTQIRMIRPMHHPEGGYYLKGSVYEVEADTAQRWIDGGVAALEPVAEPAEETVPKKTRKSTATSEGA
jgi:hypothetical protein